MHEPGQTLSHYRLIQRIGAGGMGVVWKALDTTLDREVAIKFLPEGLGGDPTRSARFGREAKLLAAVNHSNVAAIHGLERSDGTEFLVLELVEGETLRSRILAGPMSIDEVLDTACQIAAAMEAAHASEIVHRDLKPANVMVARDGTVKVLDLGLAKLVEPQEIAEEAPTRTASLTMAGTVMGTVGYMSPEQAEGRAVGPPSDVFSMGTLFYEMVSGANPFKRESVAASLAAILNEQPRPIRSLRRDVPRELRSILDRCLAKRPEERYPSAGPLRRDLEASRERFRRRSSGARALLRRPAVALPVLALLAVALVVSVRFWMQGAERRRAREELLPEVERLVAENWNDYTDAYELAVEAERYIPSDPRLAELLTQCSRRLSVTTDPPGAEIFVKNYASPGDEWTHLGTSPLADVRLPVGILRWKIEKPGFETVLAASSSWNVSLGEGGPLLVPNDFSRALDPVDTVPPGMVRVEGGPTSAGELGDFYIDRYEVTNRQFKEFVDAGAYRSRDYWKYEFEDEGTALTWEEATARFVDQTDRPGPSTWSLGTYPEGRAEHPVSGISWYEAAAYAEFVGKSLPTESHWGLARGEATTLIQFPQLGGFAIFAPFSNFDGQGTLEVGSLPGITSFGAYDMAGNVREWCLNATRHGRMVRGGSWSDATYMFTDLSQLPAMDRSPQNGLRCAFYPEPDRIPAAAWEQVQLPPMRDPYTVEPVSDEIFEAYRERYAYDRTELNARVESREEDNEYWIHEVVSYDASYGGERIPAHLFLPRSSTPPYQTVVYFPGSGSIFEVSSANIEEYFEFPVFVSFIVRTGRAVLYPVYKGTFERQYAYARNYPEGSESRRETEYTVQLFRDFSRSVDYLETREDIDRERLAYYGLSWGANLGGIITALDDRPRASVLIGGGVETRLRHRVVSFRPETDPLNFLPRVETPTLMINGRHDMFLPVDDSIQPMIDLLGTPAEHKKLLLYDTDHIPPRNEFIKETLTWLDRYLGPVR